MHTLTHKKQSGFSMVELLIAMMLSVMLAAGILNIFVNNRHSFRQDDNIARMQDDARHALREIAFDISMAGHYADLHVPTAVDVDGGLSIGTDCGPTGDLDWMYWATDPVTGESLSLAAVDNATELTVAAAHSCIAGAEFQSGTDVVSIKRVVGAQTAAPSAGNVYLRTNGTVGYLFKGPAPTAAPVAVVAPSADWRFRPSIYFIREYANAVGDGIPTLCRKIMDGAGPAMTTECLATGIENLQIEYGIDTSFDGHPNVYISNPTTTQMQSVVAAHVFLIARTTEIDSRYTNNKTYSISNAPDFTPNDSFHRRVFSISVSIRNIRNLNIMSF
jgi:type IV pilus assembly protein PilW